MRSALGFVSSAELVAAEGTRGDVARAFIPIEPS